MATSADVLRVARNELGTTSGKKYWDFYFRGQTRYVNGAQTPYCACFVSWVFHQVGMAVPGLPAAYCPYICRDGIKNHMVVTKSNARPGDIVLFDWNKDGASDHIGIVESNQGTHLQTIEGNTNGGKVARRTRYFTTICHVIRPSYDKVKKTLQSSTTSTKPATKAYKRSKLDVDGWAGPKTVTELQKALDIIPEYIDGVISGQYVKDKPALGNVVSCTFEGFGSETVAALRKYVGLEHGYHWGKGTSKAFQRKLVSLGYPVGTYGVDGIFGKDSCKALQRALNDKKI